MKTINVTFEDKEYEQLLNRKQSQNWHDFILSIEDERKKFHQVNKDQTIKKDFTK